jgi:hypothetical protein
MDDHRRAVAGSRPRRTRRHVATLVLVAVLAHAATGVAAAAATTNATSVATDQTFSGFTLGAAVVAVLVGGVYWYYRR